MDRNIGIILPPEIIQKIMELINGPETKMEKWADFNEAVYLLILMGLGQATVNLSNFHLTNEGRLVRIDEITEGGSEVSTEQPTNIEEFRKYIGEI